MRKPLVCVLLTTSLMLGACHWPDGKNGPTPTPTPATEVKIVSPPDRGKVKQTEMVKGTSRNIPNGQVIWVVVFVHNVGRYFPQNRPADVQSDGDWASVTYFGIPTDAGLVFDAIAVLADDASQTALNNYLTEARDKKEWRGMEELPAGAKIYSRVTVTRE